MSTVASAGDVAFQASRVIQETLIRQPRTALRAIKAPRFPTVVPSLVLRLICNSESSPSLETITQKRGIQAALSAIVIVVETL
jgi:hypothetical protein